MIIRHRFTLFSTVLLCVANTLFAQQDTTPTDQLLAGESVSLREQPPLYIPNCASPRETIESFNALALDIAGIFQDGSHYGDVDRSAETELINLFAKMTYLLDTSQLPKSDQFAQTHIIVCQLSEVLDRLKLPPVHEIPDSQEIKGSVRYWRFPNTEIALERLQEGPRKGDWVFSSQTVGDAGSFYNRVKDMPYRDNATVGDIGDRGGILDHYIAYTGPLIPVDFIDIIPHWLRTHFFGDPLWKYLASLLVLLVLFGIGALVRLLTRYKGDKAENPNRIFMHVRRIILPLSMVLLLPLAIHLITVDVRLRLMPLQVTNDILWTTFYVVCFWLCVCISNLVSAVIIASPSISPLGLDASLVRLGSRLVAYIIGFWILIEGLQSLGLSLVPLLAGVGVSGLAFALAARPTLGNILAGVLIFADKPFRVGERVVINKHDGVVEEIGLRSTRIRTLDGHLLSVPNEEVSSNYVENIGARPYVKRTLNVGLTYDTSPEKIQEAMAIIKQLLSEEEDGDTSLEELGRPPNKHVNSEQFPPRVYFNDLKADSLNIIVIYWFAPPNYFDYLEHTTWFNLELIKRFNAAGIDFAFPTQTIELKQADSQPE